MPERGRLRRIEVEMAGKALTECWREALAAKPSDWTLYGHWTPAMPIG